MSAYIEQSQKVSTSFNVNLLKWYISLVSLSLLIKIPLVLINYYYGFLLNDISLINRDGIVYVEKAVNGIVDIRIGGHWLYVYMNEIVYKYSLDEKHLYLWMSVINVMLSSLLPLVLLPALRIFKFDSQKEVTITFVVFSILMLFWPTSLWISSQNMKDILIALLFSLYISIFILALNSKNKLGFTIIIIAGIAVLFLIFSVRSYLAVFMIGASFIYVFIKERQNVLLITGFLVLFILIYVSPIGNYILSFLNPQNNWLLNPSIAKKVSQSYILQGENTLVVNFTMKDILVNLVRTIFNPFPKITWGNFYELLLTVRTIFISLFFYFFVINMINWKSRYKLFFVLNIFFPLLFYAVAESYSGPRQVFSSIEMIFLFLLPYFYVKNKSQFNLKFSLFWGMVITFGLFLVTSKGIL